MRTGIVSTRLCSLDLQVSWGNIEKLDKAVSELESAGINLEQAKESYEKVVIPGTPLVEFSNGNNYMRLAKNNLLTALSNLNQAFRSMVSAP